MDNYSVQTVLNIVPLLLVLGAIVFAVFRHQTARQQQVQGIIWLQAMRMLLAHIQRHRGLSSGMLSGEKTLVADMEETQKQVSRDFNHISAVGDWVKAHQGWQSITQHWARLAGNVYNLTVHQAIDQHNRLIKNILVFVDDIASAHHLGTMSGANVNIWRELLTLAELVGQARAMGTAFCAASQNHTALVFDRAQHDLQELHNTVLQTLEAPRCRDNLDDDNLQNVLNFLAYIDSHLLQAWPSVAAKEFYQVATKTLDKLYERFDQELAKVNRRFNH